MRPIDPQADNSTEPRTDTQKGDRKKHHILARHVDLTDYALGAIGGIVLSLGVYVGSNHIIISGVFVILLAIHLHYRHKTRQKRKPNYFIVTSLVICALVFVVYGTYKYFASPLLPSFQAGIDTTLNDLGRTNDPRANTFLMAVTANPTVEYVSPIDLTLWIRVINRQTVTTTIDGYEVDASHTANGPWYGLIPISGIGRYRYIYLVGTTPEAALLIDSSVFLSVALESRALQPRENVTGWAAFECPRDHIPCFENYYRMWVRDTTGVRSSVIIGPVRGPVSPTEEYLPVAPLKANRQAPRLDITTLSLRLMIDPRRPLK
jgi:hypothetical protein